MIELRVPPLGESIVEAIVSRWVKRVGEAVNTGDTVVELETDKITVEVPAQQPGVLASHAVDESAVVHVGDLLGTVDETASAVAPPSAPPAPAPSTAASPAASAPPAPATAAPEGGSGKSSPAARRIAEERGVDIAMVQGTGRGGVVSKPDVLAAPAAPPPAGPAAPAPVPSTARPSAGSRETRETRERLSTRRRRIAENLLQSHLATAHLTTFNEVDMSAVSALRERVKESVEKKHGVRLSYMPFFVRAACMALADYPTVNAQLEGDEIVFKHYVNMGIAVASDQGLVVPILKDADGMGLLAVARAITEVAKRARDGKLTLDDLTGGSFTITNGGVFGSLVSTPIINYPQSGILGLHKIQERPVAIDGRVEIRPMMYIALSYDHRIIDGQQAVLFLVRVKELMEDPAAMLIA